MNTPIFPQYIYPIGDLPDGRFIAEVGARGFQYVRELPDFDLPELDFNDDESDTIPDGRDTIPSPPPWEQDDGPLTQPIEETERPWYRRLAWWRRRAA